MDQLLRDLLPEVAPADFAVFEALGHRFGVEAGAVLYRPDEVPRGLTVIVSGRIAVERGKERIVEFGRGAYFGERTLVTDEPAGVVLRAAEATECVEFPRDAARRFLSEHPTCGYAILKALLTGSLARLSATNRAFLEVKSLARELENRNRELEDSLQKLAAVQSELIHAQHLAAIGTLVAGVAHEINNPLSYMAQSIATALERARAGSNERLVKPLELAAEGADRIRHIIGDLLDLGRQERIQAASADVGKEVETAVQMLELLAAARGVKLEAQTIASATAPLPPTKLGQVLANLLRNAIDATAPGGRVKTIARATHDRIFIQVEDSGQGIPPEVRPRIFDPFFTTKSVGEGTGLGLWICSTIIRAAGGTIDVDSVAGTGTTFTIALPRANTAAVQDGGTHE